MSADNWGVCPKCASEHISIETNMREDWEIGIDEAGFFRMVYTADCRGCDYRWSASLTLDTLKEVDGFHQEGNLFPVRASNRL